MKILEAKIQFDPNETSLVINEVAVLADFTASNSEPLSDVRMLYANRTPTGGFMWIPKGEKLSIELIKSVAAFGTDTKIEVRDTVFTDWKNKYQKIYTDLNK